MARPREFDEEKVKQALMNVFWEKGYEATSMQDLVAATGLLKGSLYGAFGDKQALYLAALEHYETTQIRAGIAMLGSDSSVAEKIGNLFNTVIESARTGVYAGGCLLCNASVEMAAVDSAVQQVVQKQIRGLEKAIAGAIGNESTRDNAANRSLATFVVAAYFGARVIAKAGLPIAMLETTRDRCLEYINQNLR